MSRFHEWEDEQAREAEFRAWQDRMERFAPREVAKNGTIVGGPDQRGADCGTREADDVEGKVNENLPTIGPKQRTPEWYALRRNIDDPRFGATDAAGLIGVSKWKSPRHIYEEFMAPPEPLNNESMRIGRVMEEPITILYAEDTRKHVVRDLPALLHPTLPLFASLDALALPSDFPIVERYTPNERTQLKVRGQENVVEVKWSMSPSVASQLGEEGTDWVPNEWACQVQQQMDVAVLEVAEIAVFLYGKLRIYRVPR